MDGGTLTLASSNDQGPGTAGSSQPSLSADGTVVAFRSAATLDPADIYADGASYFDVYVKDLITGDLTFASTSDIGDPGPGDSSEPSLSADGTLVVFDSGANLDPNDATGKDVYVKDLVTGRIALVSTSDDGTKGNATSQTPSLSADGSIVSFASSSTNLDPDDHDGTFDVYMKEVIA